MIFQKGLLDIFVLAMLWGPSFLFCKVAVRDVSPLTIVAIRILLGTLFLFCFIKLKNLRFSRDPKLWMHCFILGIFANGLPFICYTYAVIYIPTSLSALINGTVPILTVILANLFLSDERLNWNRAIGVLLGMTGFLVIFLPSLLGNGSEQGFDKTGIVLSLLGSSCYGIAAVYARKYVKNAPAYTSPCIQLLLSLIYLIPLAFIFETPSDLLLASKETWASIIALGLFGTTLGYIMYYRIVRSQTATSLSMVTYLIPIVGTTLGLLFLNETVGIHFCIAALLILSGILVVNGVIRLPTRVLAKG